MRTFTRASDRQGNPIRGVYIRDGRFYAGYRSRGRWRMKMLQASDSDLAQVERVHLVRREKGYLPPQPQPEPRRKEIDQIYSDARRLAQQLSLIKPTLSGDSRRIISEAEGLVGRSADLVFEAWKKTRV